MIIFLLANSKIRMSMPNWIYWILSGVCLNNLKGIIVCSGLLRQRRTCNFTIPMMNFHYSELTRRNCAFDGGFPRLVRTRCRISIALPFQWVIFLLHHSGARAVTVWPQQLACKCIPHAQFNVTVKNQKYVIKIFACSGKVAV